MMKRFFSLIVLACLSLLFIPSLASADLLYVEIDLTGYAGRDITLSFGLWNNNSLDDSSVRIDNVALDGLLNFEGPTPLDVWYSGLDAFGDPNPFLDPTVTLTPPEGTSGEHVMQMADHPTLWPVLADHDYPIIVGTTLSFDLDTSLSDVPGNVWGLDFFEVVIWDNSNFDDILPALTVNSTGVTFTSPLTDVTVVPVPGAVLLAGLGLGTSAFGLFRKKRRLQK